MIKKTFFPDSVEQTGSGIRKTSVKAAFPQIILKLASSGSYDLNQNIKGRDGHFIPETDVSQLTAYAISHEPYIKGKKEFADLLTRIGVDPALVANETIRRRMPGGGDSSTPLDFSRPHETPPPPPRNLPPPEPPFSQAAPPPSPSYGDQVVVRRRKQPQPRKVGIRETSPLPQDIPLPDTPNEPTKRKSDNSQPGYKKVAYDPYDTDTE